MAKRKTRRLKSSRDQVIYEGWWRSVGPEGKRRFVRLLVHVLILGSMIGGAAYGLISADRYVRGMDRYEGPIELALQSEPAWLAHYPRVREALLQQARAAIGAPPMA